MLSFPQQPLVQKGQKMQKMVFEARYWSQNCFLSFRIMEQMIFQSNLPNFTPQQLLQQQTVSQLPIEIELWCWVHMKGIWEHFEVHSIWLLCQVSLATISVKMSKIQKVLFEARFWSQNCFFELQNYGTNDIWVKSSKFHSLATTLAIDCISASNWDRALILGSYQRYLRVLWSP